MDLEILLVTCETDGKKSVWDMEFESLLYVPEKAWALKHQSSAEEYPHISSLSYETGSNKKADNK